MVPNPSDNSSRNKSPQTALAFIRNATTQCHASMEQDIDWSAAFSSPARYVELLRRFRRVIVPLETRLGEASTGNEPVDTVRSDRLQQDIQTVMSCYLEQHEDPGSEDRFTLKQTFAFDATTTWGVRYVLEGSALGGQILSKQLRTSQSNWTVNMMSTLDHSAAVIDRYFVGRGQETGSHWRTFCEQLNESLSDEEATQRAAHAAIETFGYFHSSLAGKAVCVRP